MKRVLSAVFGTLFILVVIAVIAYFVIIATKNQVIAVSFVSNGGTTVEKIAEEPGSNISSPTSPVREGYTFTGWFIDRNCTMEYHFTTMPESSVILYAGWEERIFQVKFYLPIINSVGGFVYDGENNLVLNSSHYSSKTVAYNGTLLAANIPTGVLENYTGYTGQWKYYNAENGEEITSLTNIRTDINAKPVFSVKKYKIDFYIGQREDNNLFTTLYIDFGKEAEFPDANPTKIGYQFKHWMYNDTELTDETINDIFVRENIVFESAFDIETYTINFFTEGGDLLDSQLVSFGDFAVDDVDKNSAQMLKTGYHFASWTIMGGARVDVAQDRIEGSLDLYPIFEKNLYRVSFFYNDPNTNLKMIWDESRSEYVAESGTFTFTKEVEFEGITNLPTLPTLVNFTGVGWAGYDRETTSVEISNNTEIEVDFERIAYLIKFDGNEGTFNDNGKIVVVTVDENLSDVWAARIKTISEPSKTGTRFFGWNVAQDGTGSTFNKDYALTTDITVYADYYNYDQDSWSYEIEENEGEYYARIISYNAADTKVIIPEQVYAPEAGDDVDVVKLGNGVNRITNIERIKYLVIGSCVEEIAYRAFYGANIDSIKFKDGSRLNTIGDEAFATIDSGSVAYSDQYSVKRIELPESVSTISPSAFYNAVRLESITVDSNNANYTSIDGVLYNKAKTILYAIPHSPAVSTLTIPASVEVIKTKASYFISSSLNPNITPSFTSIVFEEGSKLKTIESYAFHYNYRLTSFAVKTVLGVRTTNLPLLETVGEKAFCKSGIDTFNLPDGTPLISIGTSAFEGCLNIDSFSIPASVTSIGNNAFLECSKIKSVTLPANIASVPRQAFSGCTSLTSVTFTEGDTLTLIDESAFLCSGVTTIDFSKIPKLERIAYSAFNGSNITAVDLESCNYLTTIEQNVFANCANLISFKINEQLTSLGNAALSGTSSLSIITVEIANSSFSAENNVLYNGTKTTLLCYPSALNNNAFSTPSSCTVIKQYAFNGNIFLVSLNLGGNVTNVESYAFSGCSSLEIIIGFQNVTTLGANAFLNCASLDTIGITENIITLSSQLTYLSEYTFSGCNNIISVQGLTGINSISGNVFKDCTSLKSFCSDIDVIDIPEGVETIYESAFSGCTSILEVDIPATVTSINTSAFYGNSMLQTVNIAADSNLNMIGNTAFYECRNLAQFNFLGSCALTTIGGSNGQTFRGCTKLTTFDFIACAHLTKIENLSFCNTGLQNIVLPSSVIEIGDQAFSQCNDLSSVKFMGQVTTIGDTIFYNSSNLLEIKIPSASRTHYLTVLSEYVDKLVDY